MPRTTPMTTADDLRARPDDGKIYEVISTELVVREKPSKKHDKAIDRAHALLSAHADEGDLGAVFRWPWPVELSRYDLVRPDVTFVAWGRDGVIGVDGVRGAPELIVEVVSPETRERDLGEKQRLYQWAKVFEYWVVDPDEKGFQAFTRTKFGLQPIPFEGTAFRSVLMPELSFDVETLFR
jgi:Uma2 family endonuclease